MRYQVEVMHGVNFNMLGKRDAQHYGDLDLTALELEIERYASELELELTFFQTNHEGEFVEELHRIDGGIVEGILLNPGAWTHYSWAIHDALELITVPAVEVHLSDLKKREELRQRSVISDLCLTTIAGKGVEGYKLALQRLVEAFRS